MATAVLSRTQSSSLSSRHDLSDLKENGLSTSNKSIKNEVRQLETSPSSLAMKELQQTAVHFPSHILEKSTISEQNLHESSALQNSLLESSETQKIKPDSSNSDALLTDHSTIGTSTDRTITETLQKPIQSIDAYLSTSIVKEKVVVVPEVTDVAPSSQTQLTTYNCTCANSERESSKIGDWNVISITMTSDIMDETENVEYNGNFKNDASSMKFSPEDVYSNMENRGATPSDMVVAEDLTMVDKSEVQEVAKNNQSEFFEGKKENGSNVSSMGSPVKDEQADAEAQIAQLPSSSLSKNMTVIEESTMEDDAKAHESVTINNHMLAHEETEEIGLDLFSLFDGNVEDDSGCTALIPYSPAKNCGKPLLTGDSSSTHGTLHKGLVNLGNTCYLNSALQMIISVEDFVDEIVALYEESINGDSVQDGMLLATKDCQSEQLSHDGDDCKIVKPTQYPLRDALAEFFLSMDCVHRQSEGDENGTNSTAPANPSKLKNIVDELTPQFAGFRQQDSHEFLSTLLDLLHDEMKLPPTTEKRLDSGTKEDKCNTQYVLVNDEVSTKESNAITSDVNETKIQPHKDDSINVGSREEMNILSKKTEEDVEIPTAKREDDCYIVVKVEPVEMGDSNNNDVSPMKLVKQDENHAKCAITENTALRKTTSYAELSVEDIGTLLHDEQAGHRVSSDALTQPLPVPYRSWASVVAANDCTASDSKGADNVTTCKLVGGRIAPSASQSLSLKSSSEGHDKQDFTEQDPSVNIPNNITMAIVENDDNDIESEKTVSHDDTTTSCETPVDKYFTTKIRTHLTCNSCKFSRSHIETFRYLPIEIDLSNSDVMSNADAATVQDGLRQFFSPENREIKCEKCFGESATQTNEIVQLPQAMIIHLKRFIMDASPCFSRISFRKNENAVEFGDVLSLDSADNTNGVLGEYLAIGTKYPECTKVDGDNWCKVSQYACNVEEKEKVEVFGNEMSCANKFKLRSVVHHIGSSASCGHYTNDSMKHQQKTTEREWFRFNDSYVSSLTPEIALGDDAKRNAYMLMYVFDPDCSITKNEENF